MLGRLCPQDSALSHVHGRCSIITTPKKNLQGGCGKALGDAKVSLVSFLPQFPFCCTVSPLLPVRGSWKSPVPLPITHQLSPLPGRHRWYTHHHLH